MKEEVDVAYEYLRNSDEKSNDISSFVKKIAKNLDEVLQSKGEDFMKFNIQILYNIFKHPKRKLINHNLAYQLIVQHSQNSNDQNIFILLPTLDCSRLTKENLENAISFKHQRKGMIPDLQYSYLNYMKSQIIENKKEIDSLKRATKKQSMIKLLLIFLSVLFFIFAYYQMNQKNKILNELSKLNDSLLNTANEFNNSLLNTTNKINNSLLNTANKINNSFINITNEINNSLLSETNKINKELFKIKGQTYWRNIDKSKVDQNRFKKFIPVKQKWNSISNKEIFLTSVNQTYEIIASSTAGLGGHHVQNLFNDKLEPNNQDLCWRNTEDDKMPQIKIKFTNPVVVNAFLITSRSRYFIESPTSFEIFGVNQKQQEKSLGSFIRYSWKSSETLIFPFENENLYSIYIFRMYTSQCRVIGMAEFNLGFLP